MGSIWRLNRPRFVPFMCSQVWILCCAIQCHTRIYVSGKKSRAQDHLQSQTHEVGGPGAYGRRHFFWYSTVLVSLIPHAVQVLLKEAPVSQSVPHCALCNTITDLGTRLKWCSCVRNISVQASTFFTLCMHRLQVTGAFHSSAQVHWETRGECSPRISRCWD